MALTQLKQEPIIYFANVPHCDDLWLITALINRQEKRDASARSAFHWQLLKCRIIIFTLPEILSAPVLDHDLQVLIIIRKDSFHNGALKELLKKQFMEMRPPGTVTAAAFESCFRYTMTARIAPLWCPLGVGLVQGRDFLVAEAPVFHAHIELKVSGTEMSLAITGGLVRIVRMSLAHLGVTMEQAQQSWDRGRPITDADLGAQWVFVLPSLKKGRVVSVWKSIPPSCPYKTYKDLKRHWKNAYGYRLPEDSTGMLFYEIYFRPLGPIFYTYPDVCVRAYAPRPVPRTSTETGIGELVRDLNTKIKTICGVPFQVAPEKNYQLCELLNANEAEHHPRPNVTCTPVRPSARPQGEIHSQPWMTQDIPGSYPVSLCTPAPPVRELLWSNDDSTQTPQYNAIDHLDDLDQSQSQAVMTNSAGTSGAPCQAKKQMPEKNNQRVRPSSPPPFVPYAVEKVPQHFTSPPYVPIFNSSKTKKADDSFRLDSPKESVPFSTPAYFPIFKNTKQKYSNNVTTATHDYWDTSLSTDESEQATLADSGNAQASFPTFGLKRKVPSEFQNKGNVPATPLFSFGGAKKRHVLPAVAPPPSKLTVKVLPAKQARVRPVVQLDTVTLKGGGRAALDKATVPSLIAWLRAQGRNPKKSARKSELVEQAEACLKTLNN